MEKLLTIIIPVFNMERYLGKCLDSLIVPEMGKIEVLVINDGSNDRSSAIAHSYSEKFPKTFHVIDKGNGNYGSCINRGLKIASGKYVKVLDADDYFDSEVLSYYIRRLECSDSDVIITDYDIVDENYNIVRTCKSEHYELVNVGFDKILPVILNHNQMHGITYKTAMIRALDYHQTEGISYTDTEWTFIPLISGQTYSIFNCGSLYKYLVGRKDQTMSPEVFLKKLPDQFTVLLSRARFYEKYAAKIGKLQIIFLENSFLNQAHYIYLAILSNHDTSSKKSLLDFDTQLHSISNHLYLKIGNLDYTPSTGYKMVDKFRNSQNPLSYSIPYRIRFKRILRGFIRRLSSKLKQNL